MTDAAPGDSFQRHMWIQDFAACIAELGAPGPMTLLIDLGAEHHDKGANQDAQIAAQHVWDDWPPGPAPLPKTSL